MSEAPSDRRPARRPLRIGLAGFHVECCTFTPHVTGLDALVVRRGDDLLALFEFTRPGARAWAAGVEWVPLVHARALPGGPVDPGAYEAVAGELLTRAGEAGGLDGVLLDLHGAMSVPGHDDVEAELTAAVRRVVGPQALIGAATDTHGNITEALVGALDLISGHRLSPHEDEWETRERVARLLVDCLRDGVRPVTAWARIPVLLPGEKTSTWVEPARSLFGQLGASAARPGVLDASLWVGYAWADEPRCAAAAAGVGTDADAVRAECDRLAGEYWAVREGFVFVGPTAGPVAALEQAVAAGGHPFVISDSGDNPTAGGTGDVAVLLGLLLAHPGVASGQVRAIYAGLLDAAGAVACAEAGVGATVSLQVGASVDPGRSVPVALVGQVVRVVEPGSSGPGALGGLTAVVRAGGADVVLTSRRRPFHFRHDFTDLGLDPAAADVVIVKIGYLEPELVALADGWVIALTPGAVDQDLARLGHHRLTRPIFPFDPVGEADAPLARVVRARSR